MDYGALTRWGNTNTHITVYDTRYSTQLFQLRSQSGPELSGKVEYVRARKLDTLNCGTLHIKLAAFMPTTTSKVIFYSMLHSSVGRQFKTSKLEYFGTFGLKILSK